MRRKRNEAAAAGDSVAPQTALRRIPAVERILSANEKQVDLTKMTLTAPQGLAFGAATREPAGWTANKTDTVITWSGGAVKPDRFETWGFEIEGADQPGTLTYKATLGYADAHDLFVETLVTTGVLGLLALIAIYLLAH